MQQGSLSLVLAVCLAVGCTNEITGSLEVDGKAFVADSCNSGQESGFTGVDLIDASGRKVRLVMTPTAEAAVVLFLGESVGIEVGRCGAFTLNNQNSTVNEVRNVAGNATLECSANDHTVKGTVTFKNCH